MIILHVQAINHLAKIVRMQSMTANGRKTTNVLFGFVALIMIGVPVNAMDYGPWEITWEYKWKNINGNHVNEFFLVPSGAIFADTEYSYARKATLSSLVSTLDELQRSTDNGSTWQCICAWLYPIRFIVCSHPDGRLLRATDTYLRESFEDGEFGTWSTLSKLPAITALAVDSMGRIYVGGDDANSRSSDNGATWDMLPFPVDRTVVEYVFENDYTIYASAYSSLETNQFIYLSNDNGETWNEILQSQNTTEWLLAVTDSGVLVTSCNTNGPDSSHGGVYRSLDNGVSWISVVDILPEGRIESLISPGNEHVCVSIYGGGVYESTDGGMTWNSFNDGLPDDTVHALGVDQYGNLLVSIDEGWIYKAMLTGTDVCDTQPGEFDLIRIHPNPFNNRVRCTFTMPHTASTEFSVYSIGGQVVRHVSMGMIPAGTNGISCDGYDDSGMPCSSGVYVFQIQSGITMMSGVATLVK